MRTIRMVIEYDGSAYCGWQRQINGRSIQEVLEGCIGRITGEVVRVIGSGRTDAGVHALHQVAHFCTATRLGAWNLLMGINSVLPPDIVIRELGDAAPGFHARFDALSKVYRYRICNRPIRPVMERHGAWFVWEPLDLARMEAAQAHLRGTHDFASFCSTHADGEDRVRTITAITMTRDAGGMIDITLEADGFLRYMVRTIVGTLVEVGRGKRTPEEVAVILAARDRRRAGMTAPPQGLYLIDVKYR